MKTRMLKVITCISLIAVASTTVSAAASVPSSPVSTISTPSPDSKSNSLDTSVSAPAFELPDPTSRVQQEINRISSQVAETVSSLPGYGGTWVDDKGVTHVALTDESFDSGKRAISVAVSEDVVIDKVEYTYANLVSRRDTIANQFYDLQAEGLNLMDWGPSERENSIWISLTDYSEEKAALARKLLGSDVDVQPALANGGAGDLYSRSNDSSPYSAGIYLNNNSGPYPICSSGMPIVIKGVRYFVTAAHCTDPNLGLPFPSPIYNGGTYIGQTNWADFTANGVDAAVVNAAGHSSTYRTASTYINMETTPWNSLVGQTVCSGGAFSGEKCSLPVIAVNNCSNYLGYRLTCGVSTAGGSGKQAAGHGDCGGPMYIMSPAPRFSGIVVAAASPQFNCSVQGPIPPGSVRGCSDYVRFQTIQSILSHWNTTM